MQTYLKPMTKEKINKAIIYDKFFIDILCARKLKEIISDKAKFIGQEIFICDKEKVYGTIILNHPTFLDIDFFKNHESRHFISNSCMEECFPDTAKFNAFSFRITKIFKEPLQYTYMGEDKLAMGEFVEGVNILEENIDYSDVSKALNLIEYEDKLESFKSFEVEDEDKELHKLFLQLYGLFIMKLAHKAAHPVGGRRPCPAGMHRDRRTGRCVRNKSKEKTLELKNA